MTQEPNELDQLDVDLTAEEFQDYDGELTLSSSDFDFRQLLSPASMRGIAAVVVSLLMLQFPDRSSKTLAILLAVILIAWSIGGLAQFQNEAHRNGLNIARVAVLLLLGLGLIVWPRISVEQLGRAAGIALIAAGLFNGYRVIGKSGRGARIEPLVGATLYVAVGVSLLLSPETVLGIALLLMSTYWFIAGVASVVINIRRDDDWQVQPSQIWTEFLHWIQARPNTADDRLQLYQKIFYEGNEAQRRLSRFFILMGFATAIAAWGIIADSTAVVIGAMLIAPLMTPMMGTSLAMIMGWPKRAGISFLVALGGVLLAVGLSIGFGWLYPLEISAELNSQVASRIGPTLVDLAIAIFAGGAGAFALSRPDVSDSLPGVAVAIALVPPLSVIGLMISQGNWSEATGASLLFTTNLVAILLVGALVFILEGVVPLPQLSQNARWVKLGLGMIAALALVVIGVLGVSTSTFQDEVVGAANAADAVDDWIEGTDLERINITVSDDRVTVTIAGSDPAPDVDQLASTLESTLGRPVDVTIKVVPTEIIEFEAAN